MLVYWVKVLLELAKIDCGIYFGDIFLFRCLIFNLVVKKKPLNLFEKMLISICVHHSTYEYVTCFDGINYRMYKASCIGLHFIYWYVDSVLISACM